MFTRDEVIDLEREMGVSFGPFHQEWYLRRAPEKVQKYLRLAKENPNFVGMPRQGFEAMDLNDVNPADFTARNTFTTEVSLLGDTIASAPPQSIINQYCAIPANDARAGKAYQLMFGGVYGTTSTPTIIFTPRWGSSTTIGTNVSLGASQTLTCGTTVSNLPWFGMFTFGIRTAGIGATQGTGKGHGFVILGTSTTATVTGTMGSTAATIDTTGQGTAGCGMQMGVTWSASSASNTITPQTWILQSLN